MKRGTNASGASRIDERTSLRLLGAPMWHIKARPPTTTDVSSTKHESGQSGASGSLITLSTSRRSTWT